MDEHLEDVAAASAAVIQLQIDELSRLEPREQFARLVVAIEASLIAYASLGGAFRWPEPSAN